MSEVLETAPVKGLNREASKWGEGDAAAAQVEAQRGDAPSSDEDDDGDADDDDDSFSSPMDLMRKMLGMGDEKELPVDEQLTLLKEAADGFINRPSFEVGELITPRKHSSTKGAGNPHIVVEVLDDPIDTAKMASVEVGSNAMGKKIDLRVLCIYGDRVAAHLVESAEFVRWIPSENADPDAKS